MAILHIQSENPALSWILAKNPETQRKVGSFTRPLRKGTLSGWFSEEGRAFTLWFRETGVAFPFAGRGASVPRNDSPYFIVAALDAMLASVTRAPHAQDTGGHLTRIWVSALALPSMQVLNAFRRHFEGRFDLSANSLPNNLFELEVYSRASIHDTLTFLKVLAFMQAQASAPYVRTLPDDQAQRYIRMLNAIDAPYFIRYLFSRNLLTNRARFKKLAPLLAPAECTLKYGDTRVQRFEGMLPWLPGGACLVDIGCGTLWQSLRLAETYTRVEAWDADDRQQRANQRHLTRKGMTQVVLHGAATPDTLQIPEGADVLLTEVLEHLPLAEARALLEYLSEQPFRTLVITVPNREFNHHYGVTLRHSDHQWEPDAAEFVALVAGAFADSPGTLTFSGVGDSLHGQPLSLMAVVQRQPHPCVAPSKDLF